MSRDNFRFQRGEFVRDIITGFSGVVISRMDSITGCDRYCVQPAKLQDNKMIEAVWIDDHCLELDPERIKEKINLNRRIDQPPG